jgi:hypothetical protein
MNCSIQQEYNNRNYSTLLTEKQKQELEHTTDSNTTGGTVAHYRRGKTSGETLDYRCQLPRLENYTVVCSANK